MYGVGNCIVDWIVKFLVYIYSLVLECYSGIKLMWKGFGGNFLINCFDWVFLYKRYVVFFICWWIFVILLEIVFVK